ncbi:serine/threonine-protein kinase Rim15p [Monosporozyma unispora]|nr:rim15, signal transduction response regulator [Kazachstania unispora]
MDESDTSELSNSSLTYEDYLKLATDQQSSVILELDNNGCIQYISKQWLDMVSLQGNNNEIDLPLGKPIETLIKGNENDKSVFKTATDLMLQNDNISYIVTFTTLDDKILEASGILIMNDQKVPTHSMWIIKPFIEIEYENNMIMEGEVINNLYQIKDPQFWKKLGYGATYLNDYLNEIIDSNIINEIDLPPPRMELCRVCECFVPDWWLELHCQNCIVEHRIESIIQLLHDNLIDQLNLLTNLLENDNNNDDDEDLFVYKDLPLTYKSQSHVINIIHSLIQLCQWAININTSELLLKYQEFNNNNNNNNNQNRSTDHVMSFLKQNMDNEHRTNSNISTSTNINNDNGWSFEFSPNTRSNIENIQLWENPLNNKDNQDLLNLNDSTNGLPLLINDTIQLAKDKVDAVLRLDNSMTYSLTIKNEINNDILKVINNQLEINYYESLHDQTETSNNNNTNNDEIPKLASPQPSKRKFFADSYLKNDDMPASPSLIKNLNLNTTATNTPNSDTNTINKSISHLSVGSNESPSATGHGGILAPKPRSRHSSRSVTPSTQLDFSNNIPKDDDDNNNSIDNNIPHNENNDINKDTNDMNNVSSSSLKITTSTPSIVETFRNHNTLNSPITNTNNIFVHPPKTRISDPMIHSVSVIERNETNNNNLHPKPFSSISLTPRRGSPLLMQRTNSSKAAFMLSEKSPLNSPFITGKEFLTPEQYPNIMNSPNQPLSPLLLATNHFKSPNPSIKDYDILKPISKGAYGSVYLARKKLTGEYFAIKVLKKLDMIAKNQVTNIKSERAILMVQSEKSYVAKLFATFQNKDNLFLVMEYLPGGDLAALIKMMGYLPDKWCKQYLSEIICSVNDMHQEGIIHHDLKPDNLLIDSTGHVKLIDFGLSRAGLVKRHKAIAKNVKAPSIFPSNPSTPESSSSSNTLASRLRKISNSRQNMESIDSLQQKPHSNSPADPIHRLSNDIQALKRTESQLSFSMIDVSRSSTPPPPSHSVSTNATSAGTVTANLDTYNGNITGATNITSDNLTTLTANQSILQNMSTPGRSRISSIDSQELNYLNTHNAVSSSNNSNNVTNTNSTGMSDLALFHPGNPKQNKRFFGTPDYLAPETIQGTGEDENCDWWSVGCILFELLLGYPPFHSDTPEHVFEKILACDIQWPEFSSPEEEKEIISPEAKDLILKLLVLDPKKRLGADGVEEIKRHPYLKDVDWDHVYEEEASFVPNIENPEDTDYFDSRGVVLEDFGDDEPENDDRTTIGESDADHFNLNKSGTNSNSDVPEIQTTTVVNPLLQTDVDTSSPMRLKGLSISSSGSRERENTRESSNNPMNKLSISSVLESLPQDVNNSPRSSTKSIPLAIPPHMRERRASKLSESQTEFGSFSFRNLSALDKANKDAINRLKNEHMNELPGHRRSSSGSQAGSSSENSLNKIRPGRLSINGSPAINAIARNIAKSDTSSIRSFSPDRSMSLDHSITSRKGSNASTIENTLNMNPLAASATINPNNSLYFSDTESPVTSKFRSPLSPTHANVPHVARSLLASSNTPRRSSSETRSETDDRLNAISRINSLRYRRRSQRKSGNAMGDVGYQLDILLCEPIPIHRYRATKDLESLGCTVVSCGAGDELVSRATSGVKFDIIITALRLTKLGAVDIVKLLRRTSGINSTTPVVTITNYYQEAYNTHVFDDVVEKPVDIEDLRRVIARYALKKSQEEEDTIFSDNDEFQLMHV